MARSHESDADRCERKRGQAGDAVVQEVVAAQIVENDPQTGGHLRRVVGRKQGLVDERIRRHDRQRRREPPSRRPGVARSERLPERQPGGHVNQHVEPHQARDADGEARQSAETARAGRQGHRPGPQARPQEVLARNLRHEEAGVPVLGHEAGEQGKRQARRPAAAESGREAGEGPQKERPEVGDRRGHRPVAPERVEDRHPNRQKRLEGREDTVRIEVREDQPAADAEKRRRITLGVIEREHFAALVGPKESEGRIVDHERAVLRDVNARGEIHARVGAEQRGIERRKGPRVGADHQRDTNDIGDAVGELRGLASRPPPAPEGDGAYQDRDPDDSLQGKVADLGE